MSRLRVVGRELPERGPKPPELQGPDWKQADPARIEAHLRRALALPSGGWYVVDDARRIGTEPRGYRVASRSLVAWRHGGRARVAPDACPHMGASLAGGAVRDGRLVCPWHGLELADEGHGSWCPLPVHDDGVLVWVRLPEEGEEPTDAPILPARPTEYLDAVMRLEARCEPRDVIANRLDPWHGVHFHPHSFKRLEVVDIEEDALVARVVYGLPGRIGIEVDARFHCPDPRTIVMTIVAGEGRDSVVETHATPLAEARTAVIEATLATSDRAGFRRAIKAAAFIRPIMRWAARRLWIEDGEYAERRYALRKGEVR